MLRRTSSIVLAAVTAVGVLAVISPAGATARPTASSEARAFFATHGYLPVDGIASYRLQKAAAAAAAAAAHPHAQTTATSPLDPTIGASWSGINQGGITPPDANGAIGPKSYVEVINQQLAIYSRTGTFISSISLSTLTGHFAESDPTVLWDPTTQRFYYNVWDTSQATMQWGFSKTKDPQTLPGDFCNYSSSFGYQSSNFPDYPKLGQSKFFLMIGVNFYPSLSNLHATESDLLWINKPQGRNPITTCPSGSSFNSGKFANLRNADGTQAFTPVPAIETDNSSAGYVVTMSDIECPDICGNGDLLTVHTLKPTPGNPTVPTLNTTGISVTVPTYTSPPDAPQKSTSALLDTLDGRLTHAVANIDPATGRMVVWVSHTVAGGAGSELRWYELLPTPTKVRLLQNGSVTDSSLYVFNGGVSPDRTVSPRGASHGDTMVAGFNTSNTTSFPSIQMVEKVGSNPQSAWVMVQAGTKSENDFSCSPTCRWGDYAGATPDPAANPGAAHGEVWLTSELAGGSLIDTWNWEAIP